MFVNTGGAQDRWVSGFSYCKHIQCHAMQPWGNGKSCLTATWMKLQRSHTKQSQSKRERQMPNDMAHMWSKTKRRDNYQRKLSLDSDYRIEIIQKGWRVCVGGGEGKGRTLMEEYWHFVILGWCGKSLKHTNIEFLKTSVTPTNTELMIKLNSKNMK